MRWVSCNIPIVHRVLGHSSGHICSLVLCVVVGLPSFILERPPPPSPDMGGIGEIKYPRLTETNKGTDSTMTTTALHGRLYKKYD